MKRFFSIYLTALIVTSTALPVLAEPASKILASYDVMGFGMTLANITETFTRTDDSYQIESVTKAVGMLARLKPETIRIVSQGKLTELGLAPLSYAITRELDTHKNAAAKFNWEKFVLTHTDYKGVHDLPLAQGTQDRLSLLYHLPMLIKTGQSEYTFSITDGNKLDEYRFTLAADEQSIRVPLGVFKTRLISSTPLGEEVKYEIWMNTAQDPFPYKIIITDAKGGKLTQVLTALTIVP